MVVSVFFLCSYQLLLLSLVASSIVFVACDVIVFTDHHMFLSAFLRKKKQDYVNYHGARTLGLTLKESCRPILISREGKNSFAEKRENVSGLFD